MRLEELPGIQDFARATAIARSHIDDAGGYVALGDVLVWATPVAPGGAITAYPANSSELVQRLRRMEIEYFRGWEAWTRAEYAVETREWDECHRLLLSAKQHWFTSGDMARRYALLGVMTPQYQIAR